MGIIIFLLTIELSFYYKSLLRSSFILSSEDDMTLPAASYQPRQPQDSDYYHCVEDYFETFVQSYDEHFSTQYGFWRPYIEKVIYRYLDCGDLHSPCQMQRLRPRIPVGFFLQAPPLLPFLPSKARRGIRGVALHGCAQEGAPPAFYLQHPEDSPPVLSV